MNKFIILNMPEPKNKIAVPIQDIERIESYGYTYVNEYGVAETIEAALVFMKSGGFHYSRDYFTETIKELNANKEVL